MGLNTSFDAYDGSYSGFGSWRKWLAEQINIDLYSKRGFAGTEIWKEEEQNHNLYPLLNHSDCDGELSVEECKKVLKGLKEIRAKFPKEVEGEDIEYMIYKTDTFIKGCKKAIKVNESIKFY